ncbi:chaperone protein dnaJ 20, chloroplastic-like [Cryptomeria japonica]|uniref:chaperone protein dnaJ 20, chloroplastic-like n=1 Tax=Cryptomeria japonica TaxID=3369 RepID=UPI0025AC91D1|nr:chaperone protein dnaJ 20, chloroplastic-like [Cryptomeria japonica]
MAPFTTNTANLSFHTHAFRSYDHSFNSFPSAKQSNHSNTVRRIKLNSVIRMRAIRDDHDSSSSCFLPTMTLYDVLCVPQSAELGEVKKAYREKVRIYHPDVCPPEEKEKSCKMFLLVQEAYETLSDPMLRADYDLNLLFNPQLLLSQKRNMKPNWADQIESLRVRSRSGERKTWGEKMRRSREEMAAH